MQCTKCRQSMRDMGTTPATLDKTFFCDNCQVYHHRLPTIGATVNSMQTATYKITAGKFYLRDQFSATLNNVFQF